MASLLAANDGLYCLLHRCSIQHKADCSSSCVIIVCGDFCGICIMANSKLLALAQWLTSHSLACLWSRGLLQFIEPGLQTVSGSHVELIEPGLQTFCGGHVELSYSLTCCGLGSGSGLQGSSWGRFRSSVSRRRRRNESLQEMMSPPSCRDASRWSTANQRRSLNLRTRSGLTEEGRIQTPDQPWQNQNHGNVF